uniref:Uncharacterized protein n=1 Tax=Rhizophora mucronata TaxID=61149 RepID=A0A2P2R2L9_RHIMU
MNYYHVAFGGSKHFGLLCGIQIFLLLCPLAFSSSPCFFSKRLFPQQLTLHLHV